MADHTGAQFLSAAHPRLSHHVLAQIIPPPIGRRYCPESLTRSHPPLPPSPPPFQLVSFLREEYTQRGYEEVMTPLLYRRALWETSGHLATYAENMFSVSPGMAPAALGGASNAAAPPALVASPATCADESHNHIHGGAAGGTSAPHSCGGSGAHDASADFGLKPMNCPGHCLIFAQVSARESACFRFTNRARLKTKTSRQNFTPSPPPFPAALRFVQGAPHAPRRLQHPPSQ